MLHAHAGACARAGSRSGGRFVSGLTVVELVMVMAIVAVLASVALPMYGDYQERVRVQKAISDIAAFNVQLRRYILDNKLPPDSLAAIGVAGTKDPWGRPYVYLNLHGTGPGIAGQARKNKNLVPINSDFDLYSKGKDGMSSGPLTAGQSRDDVVLANDGRFIGLASDYQ